MPKRPSPASDPAPAAHVPANLRVEDPRSIRALAHPARLAIINALASGEDLTATQCAELTGLSPSATAYHLNLLERYGFAEAGAARPDRRERPWRASGRPIEADLDISTPAGSAAAAAVVTAYMDTTRAIAAQFTRDAHEEAPEWRDGALKNADLWLTAEELPRVAAELDAVLEPFRARRSNDNLPPGVRRVRVMNVVVPHPRSSPEGHPGPAEPNGET